MEYSSQVLQVQEEQAVNKTLLQQTAIIIVNYNTPLLTTEAVKSLIQQENEITIIVVDNCSSDNSKELLSNEFSNISSVHLIFAEKNYGFAIGNNIGIDYAKKLGTINFIGIMNPDIKVSAATISALTTVLAAHSEIGLITAKTYFNGTAANPNVCAWRTPNLSNLLFACTIPAFVWSRLLRKFNKVYDGRTHYSDEYYSGKKIAYVDVVQGCFFMCTLETMDKIDNFDEGTFLYNEEDILACRIKIINKTNAVLTNEYIYHNHQIKDKSLMNAENKIFAITCTHNSRQYFINKYCNYSNFVKKLLFAFFDIDCKIRIKAVKLLYK